MNEITMAPEAALERVEAAKAALMRAGWSREAFDTHLDVLNDLVQQAPGPHECAEVLLALTLGELLGVADLNHVEPSRYKGTCVRRLLEARWPLERLPSTKGPTMDTIESAPTTHERIEQARVTVREAGHSTKAAEMHMELLNDMVQQANSPHECSEVLLALACWELRGLADLNHVEVSMGKRANALRLLEAQWPLERLPQSQRG